MARERRKWTAAEDERLKNAVSQGPESNPINWHAVAARIPGRTNKDCRKRWHYKVATNVDTGSWTTLEDNSLRKTVEKHATRWTKVAPEVGNRSEDQCMEPWNDSINSHIDHSPWKPEESVQDILLLQSVQQYGRNWEAISGIQFEHRSSLALKNRYSLLLRHFGGTRSARVVTKPKSKNSTGTSRSTSSNRPCRRFSGDGNDDSMEGGSSSEGNEYLDVQISCGSSISQRSSTQSRIPSPEGDSGSPDHCSQEMQFVSPELGPSLESYLSSMDPLRLPSDSPMLDISDLTFDSDFHFGTTEHSNENLPLPDPILATTNPNLTFISALDTFSMITPSTSQSQDLSFIPPNPPHPIPSLLTPHQAAHLPSPPLWSSSTAETSPHQLGPPTYQRGSPSQISPLIRSGHMALSPAPESETKKKVTITAFCDPERLGKLLQVVMEAVDSVTDHEGDTTVLLNVR